MRAPDFITDHLFGHWPDAQELAAIGKLGVAGLCVRLPANIQSQSHDFAKWFGLVKSSGMKLTALRCCMDVNLVQAGHEQENLPQEMRDIFRLLLADSPGTIVELELMSSGSYDVPSAPRADARAMVLIRRILSATADENGFLKTALAPMHRHWLCRIEDAVRLGMRLNQPRLGLSIDWLHWLNADGQHLEARLELAVPRLMSVNFCGMSPKQNAAESSAQIDAWSAVPLSQNQWNITQLSSTLSRMGFAGPVGLNPCALPGEKPLQCIERELSQWKTSGNVSSR